MLCYMILHHGILYYFLLRYIYIYHIISYIPINWALPKHWFTVDTEGSNRFPFIQIRIHKWYLYPLSSQSFTATPQPINTKITSHQFTFSHTTSNKKKPKLRNWSAAACLELTVHTCASVGVQRYASTGFSWGKPTTLETAEMATWDEVN